MKLHIIGTALNVTMSTKVVSVNIDIILSEIVSLYSRVF
jgi:hypothetical protein